MVEVVVVLVVLGMLAAMGVVKLLQMRSAGRRALCMKRQAELAFSVRRFEAEHGHFPGYVNRLSQQGVGGHRACSWVVTAFPYLGQAELWSAWQGGASFSPLLPALLCPEDLAKRNEPEGPLSFVANCGHAERPNLESCGVFHDHNLVSGKRLTTLDYLQRHDGAAATLMLSENLQAGFWTDTAREDVGMVWFGVPGPSSNINQGREVGPRARDLQYARPSSHHPGGVNAVYCDGHGQFLSEKIDYEVFQRLMAPDDRGAGLDSAS